VRESGKLVGMLGFMPTLKINGQVIELPLGKVALCPFKLGLGDFHCHHALQLLVLGFPNGPESSGPDMMKQLELASGKQFACKLEFHPGTPAARFGSKEEAMQFALLHADWRAKMPSK
jgi:hypothetical protein